MFSSLFPLNFLKGIRQTVKIMVKSCWLRTSNKEVHLSVKALTYDDPIVLICT